MNGSCAGCFQGVRPGLFQQLHTDPSHLKACLLGLDSNSSITHHLCLATSVSQHLFPMRLVPLLAGGSVSLDHQHWLLLGRGVQPVCGVPALHAAPHAALVRPYTCSLCSGGRPFLLLWPVRPPHMRRILCNCIDHISCTDLLLQSSLPCINMPCAVCG